jgi:hypothetical protein
MQKSGRKEEAPTQSSNELQSGHTSTADPDTPDTPAMTEPEIGEDIPDKVENSEEYLPGEQEGSPLFNTTTTAS